MRLNECKRPGFALRWIWVFVLLAYAAVPVQARSLDDVKDSGVISVAVYRDFPPYSWLDGETARGFDVDIAEALAAGLGVKLQLHWMIPDENLDDDLRNHVWKGHYLARIEDEAMLRREVADVMLRVPYDREFAFKVDPDGKVINDLVHFFAPYQRERWELLIDREQIDSIQNLAIFNYDKVGVEIDTLPDFYLVGAFRGMLRKNVVHYTTTMDAVEAMGKGEVAAVLGMQSQLQWGRAKLNQQAGEERYVIADIPMPDLPHRFWDVGMAVKDDYRGLAYELEEVINQLVFSGQMASIADRYHFPFLKTDHYLVQEQTQ
ncbi:substrate-binding periplasmic protein [Oceanobacter mangrovi]|uniref:substrate-binding periplasmic protein n=1 Tax=Oceanobacter mangrovi TaxID=2862510 RepID=UPI001C8E123F|nr:ABC transporter substrate-binding protein [Oceanobacter mangrovi]